MTYEQAVQKAERFAKMTHETYYVIRENGYQIGNDCDLDTFYGRRQ